MQGAIRYYELAAERYRSEHMSDKLIETPLHMAFAYLLLNDVANAERVWARCFTNGRLKPH